MYYLFYCPRYLPKRTKERHESVQSPTQIRLRTSRIKAKALPLKKRAPFWGILRTTQISNVGKLENIPMLKRGKHLL
jgi:hypothetical protein